MKRLHILTILIVLISLTSCVHAAKLDHSIFINRLKNSENVLFQKFLNQYNRHLKKYPNDIEVLIERCKYLNAAQFDEYEEYNPNQNLFDSCYNNLVNKYPSHPDVLIYQIDNTWGDKEQEVFDSAKESIENNEASWSKENKGALYYAIAMDYYYDDNNQEALSYMAKACYNDSQYENRIEYARILVELEKTDDAYGVLSDLTFSDDELWLYNQKASLLVEIGEYEEALEVYNFINEKDSVFNNNLDLAETMVGIKQYSVARNYLITDTAKNWGKGKSYFNLFAHDLNYHSGDTCLSSYNAYRSLGYSKDPFAIYRLKLFVKHPLLGWNGSDFASLIALIILVLVLIIIPFIWILPIHFIGHRWKVFSLQKGFGTTWGLKSFWIVSAGYFVATLAAMFVFPEYFKTFFDDNYIDIVPTESQEALSMLVFILLYALIALGVFFRNKLAVLGATKWTSGQVIGISLGILFGFKIIMGIYLRLGAQFFDFNLEEIAMMPHVFMVTQSEMTSFISTYGVGLTFLIVSVLVPIYEELIFRGVILDSCSKYINFRWANLLQSTIFALVHDSLILFPFFFAFGMITGIFRKKSGGLMPGIIFHVVNNFIAVIALSAKL